MDKKNRKKREEYNFNLSESSGGINTQLNFNDIIPGINAYSASSIPTSLTRMPSNLEGYGWGGELLSRKYDKEDIVNIISSNNSSSKALLSQYYFNINNFYKRVLMYYATLFKYVGVLVPKALNKSQPVNSKENLKRYNKAIRTIEDLDFSNLFQEITLKVLLEGSFFGYIIKKGGKVSMVQLPRKFCRSLYKDMNNLSVVEFDVSYFDSFIDAKEKEVILSSYPKEIRVGYRTYITNNKKEEFKWVLLPTYAACVFELYNNSPFFISLLPTLLDYDEAVVLNMLKEAEEVRKILVQEIDHLSDGELVLDPDEARELHEGAKKLMGKNPHLSVLTTYAKTNIMNSKTTSENTLTNNLDKMRSNIYNQVGVSQQVFSATGNLATETSVKNDMALMSMLLNQYTTFISFYLNRFYGNTNIAFKYTFLPVTWYNDTEYAQETFKLANAGYSFLLPAIAMGMNQSDLGDIKVLENDILGLDELLQPLKTSYTQGADSGEDEGGRPALDDKDKTDKTITNLEGAETTTKNGGGE